jgi:hypothetical protein
MKQNDATLDSVHQDSTGKALDWTKDGPTSVATGHPHGVSTTVKQQPPLFHTPDGLPTVNHDGFLKRVNLPYLGREQSYTWYLQLKSNAQQYGVYLKPTTELKKDMSLCPMTIFGVPISGTRYNDMKCTLYHFLTQKHIIPYEYTDLRNIINRHALNTDGYQVLYDIMEWIHPYLDLDTTFSVPNSADYGDIHEYYNYTDSYFMHEGFAGRQYSPRERVNIFIRGLDPTYSKAANRLRALMDNWELHDEHGPENLRFSKLPNLVEKYMGIEGDNPVIHRIQHKGEKRSGHQKQAGHGQDKPDINTRPYVDIQCLLCQSYGHPQTQCDRMALWLLLKDAATRVDDKLRKTLLVNYAKINLQRRQKKVTKLRGTVRQLYENGQYQLGDQILQQSMFQSSDESTLDHIHHDAIHVSTSDSDSVK